jgi:hypothetical protein
MEHVGKFLDPVHAYSYVLQMQTIYNLKGKRVLEIGPGEGFVARNMKSLGYTFHTVDASKEQMPDIVSTLQNLDISPLINNYDIVCGFQVLEHMPYREFLLGLKKMLLITKRYVVISLPYSCKGSQNFHYEWNGQNNCTLKREQVCFESTNLPNRENPTGKGHCWEIGRGDVTLEKLKKDIRDCGLIIKDEFHSPNPYHYFIVMEKKG